VHTYLKKAAAGDFDAAREAGLLVRRERAQRDAARTVSIALLGVTALFSAVLISVFGLRGVYWHGQSMLTSIAAAVGIVAFVWVWRRTR
jgi:hypothetical protein